MFGRSCTLLWLARYFSTTAAKCCPAERSQRKASDDTLSYSYKSKHEFPERLNPLPAVIWLMFSINQKKDESTNREMDSLVDVNVSSKIPKSKPMTHALHKSKLSHKHDFKILLHHYRYLDSFCWLLLLN